MWKPNHRLIHYFLNTPNFLLYCSITLLTRCFKVFEILLTFCMTELFHFICIPGWCAWMCKYGVNRAQLIDWIQLCITYTKCWLRKAVVTLKSARKILKERLCEFFFFLFALTSKLYCNFHHNEPVLWINLTSDITCCWAWWLPLTTQTFQFFTYTLVGVLNSKRTAALLLRHYRTVQRKYIFPFSYDVIIYARRMSQHTDDLTMNATE